MTTAIGSSIEHAIGAEGLLAIHIGGGEVRLRGIEGEIARVREVNDRDLAEMLVIDRGEGSLSLRSGRLLEIALGRLDGRRGVRHDAPELEIELPRRASVVIEAASCDVAAEGLVGDQRYRTASGDVTLRAATGRVSVEAVSGDIDITATGSAEVVARTVSGDLALRAATLSSVVATTTSGDVRIAGRLSGPGPFSIDTVSGDALLAPAGDVRIEMSSVTGDLSSEFEGPSVSRGRHSLEVGRSGPAVTFRSMSGDLRVVRPVPISEPAPASQSIATDDDRLRILRSLERGEIDVAEAGRRLGALEAGEPEVDGGGPRA